MISSSEGRNAQTALSSAAIGTAPPTGASEPAAVKTAGDLSRAGQRLAAAAALLLMFALALSSMAQKAPTFDEQGFLVRGLAYLRGYTQIRVGHPLGLNALNASLLAVDETVALPLDDPSWSGTSFHRPAELFLWEIGNDVEHVMFLARLPTIWLGLLLAALAGRWAGQLSGRRWAGLLALLFVALDPNILAHTRLATTDLGLAALVLAAAYTLWRFLRSPSLGAVLLAGLAMGLLQNTKFTALLFIPLFGLLILIWLGADWWAAYRQGARPFAAVPWRTLGLLLLVYPLTALLALWVSNGFDVGALPPKLPMMQMLGGRTLPLADHLEQLLDIGGRMQLGTPSFLLGQYSDSGWWYYFPAAFLLKTPLPTVILFSWGTAVFLFALARRKTNRAFLLDSLALLVPAAGYFLIAMTSDINLGYRHLLPVLAFLIVFAAAAVPRGPRLQEPQKQIAALILSGWLLIAVSLIYPDFLAYFNLLAGGAGNGWRSLVDSNLDWGQDLDDLAPWMAEHGVGEVWLSYFGEARPEYYGVNYRGLDSFPPRLANPQARAYYAADPAPGVYAISVTNLQGVHFADHDQFAWFRERDPIDKLGYSIFLYDVPAQGRAVDLVLAGVQMDQLSPALFARLGSNDVRPRWVDPHQSLIIPGGEESWTAASLQQPFAEELAPYLSEYQRDMSRDDGLELARYNAPPLSDEELDSFAAGEARVTLKRAELLQDSAAELKLMTAWQKEGPPQPLQLFVHALDENGQIVTQWDGLGAAWEGWLDGDTLLQLHTLSLIDGASAIDRLAIGVYDPQTGRRWLNRSGGEQYEFSLVDNN